MHALVVVAFPREGPLRSPLRNNLDQALASYSWIRPLEDTYVIRVESQNEWSILKQGLVSIGERYPNDFYFIMTPALPGGTEYIGFLPTEMWERVNDRTS